MNRIARGAADAQAVALGLSRPVRDRAIVAFEVCRRRSTSRWIVMAVRQLGQ
jgi:hypothetical protein